MNPNWWEGLADTPICVAFRQAFDCLRDAQSGCGPDSDFPSNPPQGEMVGDYFRRHRASYRNDRNGRRSSPFRPSWRNAFRLPSHPLLEKEGYPMEKVT